MKSALYTAKTFHAIMGSIEEGIIVLDKDGVVVKLNSVAEEMLLKKRDESIGKRVSELLPLAHELSGKGSSQSTIRTELVGKMIEVRRSPIYEDMDKVEGYVLVLKDLTQSIETEIAVKLALEKLAVAMSAAGFYTWTMDLESNLLIDYNELLASLGYALTDLPTTDKEFERLIHPDDRAKRKASLANYMGGTADAYRCEYRIKNIAGGYDWLYSYGRFTRHEELFGVKKLIGVAFNITKRKQDEEKLYRKNQELITANNEKDKFFSIIAHDLRGPFQGFIGLTELMAENFAVLSAADAKEITQALQSTAKNLYELLENLLNWALIKRGHKRFAPGKVYLNGLVQSVSEIFISQLKTKNITLINRLTDDAVALADEESLRTVLRNLLSNAIKFTPKQGKVEISCSREDDGFLLVSIKDTGIGMPPEILENLFSINKKVSRHGTDNEPSTGLGLILCKELIEKHGGKIWGESVEGNGSTLFFTIPSLH